MSAFRALAARRAPSSASLFVQRAAFHNSAMRAAGKESKLHTEGRAKEIEDTNLEQLRKQQEGKGHWEESLASDSESIVKADRGEANETQEHIKKLQEESSKVSATKR